MAGELLERHENGITREAGKDDDNHPCGKRGMDAGEVSILRQSRRL